MPYNVTTIPMTQLHCCNENKQAPTSAVCQRAAMWRLQIVKYPFLSAMRYAHFPRKQAADVYGHACLTNHHAVFRARILSAFLVYEYRTTSATPSFTHAVGHRNRYLRAISVEKSIPAGWHAVVTVDGCTRQYGCVPVPVRLRPVLPALWFVAWISVWAGVLSESNARGSYEDKKAIQRASWHVFSVLNRMNVRKCSGGRDPDLALPRPDRWITCTNLKIPIRLCITGR